MDQNKLLVKHDADSERDAETISNWRSYWKIPEEGDRFNGFVLKKILKNENVTLGSNITNDTCKKKLEELEKSWRSTSLSL